MIGFKWDIRSYIFFFKYFLAKTHLELSKFILTFLFAIFTFSGKFNPIFIYSSRFIVKNNCIFLLNKQNIVDIKYINRSVYKKNYTYIIIKKIYI